MRRTFRSPIFAPYAGAAALGLAVGALVPARAAPAPGCAAPPAIEVEGVGRATATVAGLELSTFAEVEASLAADGLLELAEARRRARAAFAAAGFEGLEVEASGAVVHVLPRSAPGALRPRHAGGVASEPRVRCSEQLSVRVLAGDAASDPEVEALAVRLVDCALDAGLRLAPIPAAQASLLGAGDGEPSRPCVRGRAADPDALERAAIAAAVADARARAGELARLGGVRLGTAVTVEGLDLQPGPLPGPSLVARLSIAFAVE